MAAHETVPWIDLPEMSDEERSAKALAYYDAMKSRHSCRKFSDQPIQRDVIETALRTAGTAPSGANHQPWYFSVITDGEVKEALREAAEEEERAFYDGKAGEQWLDALKPLGTDANKPYLSGAPYLIVIFGQRKGGIYPEEKRQNYYVTESVGIATGFLLSSLHQAGLATLTHTPNPMRFLNKLTGRPADEKPIMIIVVGHAAPDATIPTYATIKKPLEQISNWI